ncbi:DUF2314 domain-containing protein [Sphingopyxis sp. KK2]|uniref:DUF2314 domain-containing protein n=1 Tax=Sphingopyxis sp. KK2 TaxID=1855727 RepID=UPI00097E648E|nr:DUF2314 domain-containing protein [Sphingopyxis sp. KK2]
MKKAMMLAAALWLVAAPAMATPDAEREAMMADRDDMAMVEASDARMNAAIAEARARLPDFLSAYGGGRFDRATFVVKYPLGGWEHIWVDVDSIDKGAVNGRLANVPAQPEYSQGQAVRVPLTDISDWAYRDERGVMIGHRTTRVLLADMDPVQRASIEEYLGW